MRQHQAPHEITPGRILEAKENNEDLFADGRNFDFQAAPSGYAVWDMSAGVSLQGKKLRYDFRLAADNILNTAYREYTNRLRYFADETGRNFLLAVKCIF
jgi:iron complex outermembrane receptor protein